MFALAIRALGSGVPSGFSPEGISNAAKNYQTQIKEIREKYQDDPVKMAEETKQVTRAFAKAIGQEEVIDNKEKLYTKYGVPAGEAHDLLETPTGMLDVITDLSAWRHVFTVSGRELMLTIYLEARYKDAVPRNLTVVYRSRGQTREEEIAINKKTEQIPVTRFQLALQKTGPSEYCTSFSIPKEERDKFVIQIDADFEDTWRTKTVIPLTSIPGP